MDVSEPRAWRPRWTGYHCVWAFQAAHVALVLLFVFVVLLGAQPCGRLRRTRRLVKHTVQVLVKVSRHRLLLPRRHRATPPPVQVIRVDVLPNLANAGRLLAATGRSGHAQELDELSQKRACDHTSSCREPWRRQHLELSRHAWCSAQRRPSRCRLDPAGPAPTAGDRRHGMCEWCGKWRFPKRKTVSRCTGSVAKGKARVPLMRYFGNKRWRSNAARNSPSVRRMKAVVTSECKPRRPCTDSSAQPLAGPR